jgi:hypothetical protein
VEDLKRPLERVPLSWIDAATSLAPAKYFIFSVNDATTAIWDVARMWNEDIR